MKHFIKTKKLILRVAILCFCTSLANSAQVLPYGASWLPHPTLGNISNFHKYLAERVADAAISCEDVFSHNKNVAAFGLSVMAKNETGDSDVVSVMFPNTLYSAYYITEITPVMEFASKRQIIAVTEVHR